MVYLDYYVLQATYTKLSCFFTVTMNWSPTISSLYISSLFLTMYLLQLWLSVNTLKLLFSLRISRLHLLGISNPFIIFSITHYEYLSIHFKYYFLNTLEQKYCLLLDRSRHTSYKMLQYPLSFCVRYAYSIGYNLHTLLL